MRRTQRSSVTPCLALWFALWLLFSVPLSLLLMPYGYSLWLHLLAERAKYT
jgi:hypothetical protein